MGRVLWYGVGVVAKRLTSGDGNHEIERPTAGLPPVVRLRLFVDRLFVYSHNPLYRCWRKGGVADGAIQTQAGRSSGNAGSPSAWQC